MSSPGTAKRKHAIFEGFQLPRSRLGPGRTVLVPGSSASPGSLESLFHCSTGQPQQRRLLPWG